jgi:hypothetical protein
MKMSSNRVYFENRIRQARLQGRIKAPEADAGWANGNCGNAEFDLEDRLEVWVFKVDAV